MLISRVIGSVALAAQAPVMRAVWVLETSLRGTFEVRVRKDLHVGWPRAETPTEYITMGLDPDLDEAARPATRDMVDFLVSEKHLSRDDADVLCSLAGNLHVTEAVDDTKASTCRLPSACSSEAGRRDRLLFREAMI